MPWTDWKKALSSSPGDVVGVLKQVPRGTLGITAVLVALELALTFARVVAWPSGSNFVYETMSAVSLVPIMVCSDQYFEPWRLITAPVFHTGLLHVAFNAFSLISIGRSLENRIGTAVFLRMSLLLALTSGIVHVAAAHVLALTVMMEPMFTPSVGYSGVLFAYMSVFVCVPGQQDPGPTKQWSVVYTWVLLVLMSLFFPHVSWLGHMSGIFAGYLYSFALRVCRRCCVEARGGQGRRGVDLSGRQLLSASTSDQPSSRVFVGPGHTLGGDSSTTTTAAAKATAPGTKQSDSRSATTAKQERQPQPQQPASNDAVLVVALPLTASVVSSQLPASAHDADSSSGSDAPPVQLQTV